MGLSSNIDVFQKRIEQDIGRFDPKGREFQKVLFEIGTLVTNTAKLNITRLRILDTGFLRSSVRFETQTSKTGGEVFIGPFGVHYASIHEFGGEFTDAARRAMFANLRDSGRLKNYVPKGVVQGGRVTARPYLRPALAENKVEILRFIKSLLPGEK